MHIPADLVAAVAERRVIPFLGAGFSAAVGMPDWDQLLSRLAAETEGALPYDQLKAFTGGDNLQIAEYLYLKSDQRIGPLRHVLERGLPEGADPTLSPAHVELVNLGAPQIYTTNYDDLIETTHRSLGVPVNVVALGKDVAAAGQQMTQVVKYHGDLRHESTLVLTESSYYNRLDFESAMDVKFRADLLGRSVLYMGYSFRDINIRLIWFKLNKMMEDIPTADRRQSYIVRLEPNPVLEELYEAVGLKTLVLDPPGGSGTRRGIGTPRGEITSLGAFLSELATRAAASEAGKIPGTDHSLFASALAFERAERIAERHEKQAPDPTGIRYTYLPAPREVDVVFERVVPRSLESRAAALAARALGLPTRLWRTAQRVIQAAEAGGPSAGLTTYVVRILVRIGPFPPSLRRRLVLSDSPKWEIIWGAQLPEDVASAVLLRLETEIEFNESEGADEDIAYASDVASRIANGTLIDPEQSDIIKRADELLVRAAALYPAIGDLAPSPDGPPDLAPVLAQIEARRASLPQDAEEDDEDDE